MPDFHVIFRDFLHAVNLRHGTNGFTSLRIFSTWKIRLLRSGLNPLTWVPKASTLPLDHGSLWTHERNICMLQHSRVCVVMQTRPTPRSSTTEESGLNSWQGRDFFFLRKSGVHDFQINGYRGSCPGSGPEYETITSTPPYACVACCLIKH